MTEFPALEDRFKGLPKSLRERSEITRLGDDVPALVAHPGGSARVPWVLWLHGRTVYKELDPGRYARWVRAGIGAVAIDLPGHGERYEDGAHAPERTVETVTRAVGEIDGVLASVNDLGTFDPDRTAIGGMSAGGMVALRRLCDPHPFRGAAVECTTGDLAGLYFPKDRTASAVARAHHDPGQVARIDPAANLETFEPVPLLAMHAVGDELIPYDTQAGFIDRLRAHYASRGADPDLIEMTTFEDTGAPQEHAGFGKHAARSKDIQLAFLSRVLGV